MSRARLLLSIAVTALLALVLSSSASAALPAGAPFDAATPSVFVAQGNPTQLENAVEANGSLTFQNVGAATAYYNAIAFDPNDDYIYGATVGTAGGIASGEIVRVDANGTVLDTGVAANQGAASANVGAFDPVTGDIYLSHTGRNTMTVYDPTSTTPTTLGLSQNLSVYDLTYTQGYFWGLNWTAANGATIERVDPTSGTVTDFPAAAGLFPAINSFAGAAWTYGNGNIGFSTNANGNIYQVAIANPTATPTFSLVSTQPGPASNNNDGAANPGLQTDLSITKTATSPVAAGGQITYTISVTNHGPGNSSGYVVSDPLPAGLGTPATTTPGCTISGGLLTCQGNPLANGATAAPITVTGTAPDPFTAPLSNTASVLGNEQDPNAADDSSTAVTTPPAVVVPPTPAPTTVDTGVTITPPTTPTAVGSPATFTVNATNVGSGTATDTVVKIPVPVGTTFTSGPANCTLSGSSVVCGVGSLAPGATAALPIQFTPTLTGEIEVSATVAQTETDANSADNAALVRLEVPAPPAPTLPPPAPSTPTTMTADLGVTIAGPATAPVGGTPSPFTITVTNHGPDSDSGVVVSLPVPSGATVIARSPQCQVINDTVLCVAGTLESGKSISFEVSVVPSGAQTLGLTATVTGELPDVAPDNNVATLTRTTTGDPTTPLDVGVTLTAANPTVAHGAPTTLTATVTNHSARTASGVTVAIPLPAGGSLVSTPKGCGLHGTVVICRIGQLKAHGTATFMLQVRLRGTGTQGLTATVRSDQPDSKPTNNHATAKLRVTRHHLTLRRPTPTGPGSKAPVKPRLSLHHAFSHRSVLGGHAVTATLTVRTRNQTTAKHVTVCDTVAPGMTIVSAHGATVHGRRVCFTLKSVSGTPRRLRITLRAGDVNRTTVRLDHATARAPSAASAHAGGRLVVVPIPAPKFTG